MADQDASRALFERALAVIPGGVNSPVRSFRSVGGHPYFVARGEGAYVWDADGNRLLDYVQSYGASLLGHAHPFRPRYHLWHHHLRCDNRPVER